MNFENSHVVFKVFIAITGHSRQQLRLRKQIKEVPQRELGNSLNMIVFNVAHF